MSSQQQQNNTFQSKAQEVVDQLKELSTKATQKVQEIRESEAYANACAKAVELSTKTYQFTIQKYQELKESEQFKQACAKAAELKQKVVDSDAYKVSMEKAEQAYEAVKPKVIVAYEFSKEKGTAAHVYYVESGAQEKVHHYSAIGQEQFSVGVEHVVDYSKVGLDKSKKALKEYSVRYTAFSAEQMEELRKEVANSSSADKSSADQKLTRRQKRSAAPEESQVKVALEALFKQLNVAKLYFYEGSSCVAQKLVENISDETMFPEEELKEGEEKQRYTTKMYLAGMYYYELVCPFASMAFEECKRRVYGAFEVPSEDAVEKKVEEEEFEEASEEKKEE